MKFRIIVEDDIPLQPTEYGSNYATHYCYDEGSDGKHAWTAIKPDRPMPIGCMGSMAMLEHCSKLEALPVAQRRLVS